MRKKQKLIFLFIAISLFAACRSAEPVVPVLARLPEPVKPERPVAPDVIRIAVRFIEREGAGGIVLLDSAAVRNQDWEAYYVSVKRKETATRRGGEFVVKVYKMDGRAEWAF